MFTIMQTSARLTFPGFVLAIVLGAMLGHSSYAQDDGPWTEKWVLINEPGSNLQLIRATEVKVHSSIISIRTPDDKTMGWQRDFYLADAPAIPEDITGISKSVMESALEKLNALAEKAGNLAETLQPDLSRLTAAIDKIENEAAAEIRAAQESQLNAWKETEYDPHAHYPVEQLDAVILAGEQLIEMQPDFASEINERLETMKQHRIHIAAGRRYLQGQWVDPKELGNNYIEREKELVQEFFEKGFSITMPSVAFSGIPVAVLFAPAAVTIIMLLVFLFQTASNSSLPKGALGVIIIVVLLGLSGFNAYFVYGIFSGKTSIADVGVGTSSEAPPLAETVIGRAVFFSSEPEMLVRKPSDLQIALQQDEINAALERHLVYEGKGSEGMFDMVREKTALLIDPRRLSIIDEISFFNRKFLMQTHIKVEITKDSIEFYDFEVELGNTKLPGLMAAHIWKQVQPQFQRVLTQLNLGPYYGIHQIKPGEVIMIMTKLPEGAVDVEAEIRKIVQGTDQAGSEG